jgi:hypothetical protein
MWREYVKMELGFVESMRRRWEVLGIKVGEGDAKGKQKEEAQPDAEGIDPSPDVTAGEGDTMDVEEENVDETGFEARKQIMEGAIVKSVITNAAQGPWYCPFSRSLSLTCPVSITQNRAIRSFTSCHLGLPLPTGVAANAFG